MIKEPVFSLSKMCAGTESVYTTVMERNVFLAEHGFERISDILKEGGNLLESIKSTFGGLLDLIQLPTNLVYAASSESILSLVVEGGERYIETEIPVSLFVDRMKKGIRFSPETLGFMIGGSEKISTERVSLERFAKLLAGDGPWGTTRGKEMREDVLKNLAGILEHVDARTGGQSLSEDAKRTVFGKYFQPQPSLPEEIKSQQEQQRLGEE